jgi:hypothetical protein
VNVDYDSLWKRLSRFVPLSLVAIGLLIFLPGIILPISAPESREYRSRLSGNADYSHGLTPRVRGAGAEG